MNIWREKEDMVKAGEDIWKRSEPIIFLHPLAFFRLPPSLPASYPAEEDEEGKMVNTCGEKEDVEKAGKDIWKKSKPIIFLHPFASFSFPSSSASFLSC